MQPYDPSHDRPAGADQSAGDIRAQMEATRQSLDDQVRQLREQARQMADWRYHVGRHPWLTMGVAAGVGFLLVPRKRRARSQTAEAAAMSGDGGTLPRRRDSLVGKARRRLISAATDMAIDVALLILKQRINAARFGAGQAARPSETNGATSGDPVQPAAKG